MSDEERSQLIPRENRLYGTTRNESNEHSCSNVYPSGSIISDEQLLETPVSSASQSRSSLSGWNKFGFGLGHVYNDLCAGIWFSYTLLFMQNALLMPGPAAGALMMVGQVGDALATPLVGFLADKFGTKQKWHIFGTALVFVSFPMIFSLCPFCDTAPPWWRIIYFVVVVLTFQLGWAIVQVTHLAIIPEMSRTHKDRTELTAIRYSASVVSSIIDFGITWIILRNDRVNSGANIGPTDAYRFRDISLILTLIGISMTVCFHFSLAIGGYGIRRLQALNHFRKESSISQKPLTAENGEGTPIRRAIRQQKNFFKTWRLYQNTFIYVFSRLFMTTALVYIPLWLNERSLVPNSVESSDASIEHIATVPLVSFISSFAASMLMKYSHHCFGHQMCFFFGSIISIGACIMVEYAATADSSSYLLYIIATLFGSGSSVTMISSLCIIADMIGRHADQSGFIYSAVTFADKLITGIAIVVIESLKCQNIKDCPEYYRNVLAYGCGGAAVLGILTLLTMLLNPRRTRRTASTNH